MSRDKLGKTRTEKRKKELFNSKRKKTRKKAILAKQKEITERKLCKTRNVVSKSDASTKQKFQDLKDWIDKYNPISEQTFFYEFESTQYNQKIKCRINNSYFRKTLNHWNQPIRRIESYTLTVIQRRK